MANRSHSRDTCCKVPADVIVCPGCSRKGRKVGSVTLDHHLEPRLRRQFSQSAGFCPNSSCDVVYFDGTAVALTGETVLPVTQKDDGDDVFICYCFEHRRADIRRDLRATGATDIPDQIQKGIQEGRCDCERKNPQGACCLGNVAAEVKKIEAEIKGHAKAKD